MSTEPCLLFSSGELADLRRRRERDPVGRQLFYDLMAAAEWVRKQPIPTEPEGGPEATRRDGSVTPGESPYRDDYLLAHEVFEVVTFAFERAVQQLSFVYRMTGERVWAERAVAWLDAAMNQWQRWSPRAHELDQFATRIMNGTALACDWLGEAVPVQLRKRCGERVAQYARLCTDTWGESLDRVEPGQVGNHYWFNIGMLGMAALWLAEEDTFWRTLADRCGRQLDRLSDWAIGRDGDYVDKPRYLAYAFRWALPFLIAWQRKGGSAVLDKPVFAAAARWLCDMLAPGDLNWIDWPGRYLDRWILFLLAGRHRLARAQWIACRQTDRPLVAYAPIYMDWTNFGVHWNYLFYDETLPAESPDRWTESPVAWYRDSGWVVLRPDFVPDSPVVTLYAGSASGKNYHNQGELFISACGERLLEIPQLPIYGYISAHRALAYMNSNLSGSVLIADGLGQASGQYPREWPGNAKIGHEVLSPLGRITAVESGEGWSAATCDLTRAYCDFNMEGMWSCRIKCPPEWEDKARDRLAGFVRYVLLVGAEWIILQDDLATHPEQAVDLEWHFGTHARINFHQISRATLERGWAAMDLFALLPAGVSLFGQRAHFSETGKFLSLSLDGCEGAIRLLLVMKLRRRSGQTCEPIWRPDETYPGTGTIELPDGRQIAVTAGNRPVLLNTRA